MVRAVAPPVPDAEGPVVLIVNPARAAVNLAAGSAPGPWNGRRRVVVAALREAAWAGLAAVAFLAFLAPPTLLGDEGLDPGWAQLVCVLLGQGAQAGADFVFPYGPLGPLMLPSYEPTIYYPRAYGELAFKLVTALVVLRLARQLHPLAGVPVMVAAALYPLAHFGDQYLLVAALGAVWTPVLKGRVTAVDAILGPAFLAAAGLGKFNYLVFAGAGFGIATLGLLLLTRSWKAFLPVVAFAVSVAGLWAATGQRLANLPAYVSTGLEYSRGYADGMALPGPAVQAQLGAAVLALFVGTVLAGGRWLVRNPGPATGVLLVALPTAIAWKYGFVRHDLHAITFFGFAGLVPLFLGRALVGAPRPRVRAGLLAAAAVLAVAGGFETLTAFGHLEAVRSAPLLGGLRDRVAVVRDLEAHRQTMDERRSARAAAADLPAIRAKVGAEPVDVLTDSQGVPLLIGLTLAPRPTLQSANACSAELLARNARFYAGPTAPRFVLAKWTAIDNRYPALTDGVALLEVLRRYEPVLDEGGFVLFEKRLEPVGAETGRVVFERTIGFQEFVPLPETDGYLTLTVDVQPSALGSVRSAAFRPAEFLFQTTARTGETQAFRLPAGMAKSEFLLDPFVATAADIRAVALGRPGERVAGFRFERLGGERRYFRPDIRVTVREYPRLPVR